MRRFLLIVAMLLIVAGPAFATVTIGAKQTKFLDCRTVEVNYVCGAAEKVRAFALEVTVDNNYIIFAIDANKGESNKVGSGSGKPCFGIFPGKFRDWIDPAAPNWVDPNYTPVAPATDTDAAGTGIGTKKIIVEMGSLYVGDNNRPPSSGVLFRLKVDPNKLGISSCNLTIATNATRGGVVLEDGTTTTPTITGTTVSFPDCFPCWPNYDTQYSQWLTVNKPNCWCGAYAVGDANWKTQCKGDADGKAETGSKYRAYGSDYTKLVNNYAKKYTSMKSSDTNICADFDHFAETGSKYRVYTSDYTILVANYGKKETSMKPFCPLPSY